MNSGKQFGIRGSETIGSGVTKLSDNVLVYVSKVKLVVETRYNPFEVERTWGCIFFVLLALISFPSFLTLAQWLFGPPRGLFTHVLFAVIGASSIFIPVIFLESLPKNTIYRMIIDNNTGLIRFEKERWKKSKLMGWCGISSVKHIRVDVDDYSRMDIYLDSITESFYIVGFIDDISNEEKLKLAHQIAEFLGVPVIEKT